MAKPFDYLVDLFRRSELLPQLPEPALRLIKSLERPSVTSREIETVISGDPALVASLLRAASSASYAGYGPTTSLSAAILRLGHESIRTLALSFSLQAMFSRPARRSSFDHQLWARHSLYVGTHARHSLINDTGSSDQAFAVGLVHDVGVALLSRVGPDVFDQVHQRAREKGQGIVETFPEICQGELQAIGVAAIEGWGLPPIFAEAVMFTSQPDEPLWNAIRSAHESAVHAGFCFEPWLKPETLTFDIPEVASEVNRALSHSARQVA